MVVKVASKFRQSTLGAFVSSNIVGDSMLVRLRSTTIGILGLVAAVGLGLIAVVSQQGWPGVLSSPLPQTPPPLVQNDSIEMPQPAARPVARHGHGGSRPVSASANAALPATKPVVSREVKAAPQPVAVEQPQAAGHGHHGHRSQPQTAPSPTAVAQVPGEEPATEDSTVPPPAAGSPGKSGQAPGHSGESHGHSGGSHGNSAGASPQSGVSPGHSGEAPGHAAEGPPGHSGESHGGHH